jgi:ABC-2 type transport system permease protein
MSASSEQSGGASGWSAMRAVFRREFMGYFATPLAYVFIAIFLFAMGAFTFYIGGFFEAGQANLTVFFSFHPWLYLFLIPAISMRLWAEERKTGTLELIMTLPIPLWASVVGKFLAAWVFAGVALLLTFPMWITVNYLGSPDNGVILTSYLGSWLMAGSFLAIGSMVSATTNNQVIAFVITVVLCFLVTVAGHSLVIDFFRMWAPVWLVSTISSFSFLTQFDGLMKGVVDLRAVVYFSSLTALALFVNIVVLDQKRAG